MDVLTILGYALSVLIGVCLGLLGGGGSIITVPVFVYLLKVEPHAAIAMSLAVVGATSVVGAALHHRRGALRIRVALLFGGAGVFGAYLGSRITYLLSDTALLLTFGAVMLTVAAAMLMRKESDDGRRGPSSVPQCLAVGFAVGVMTGFLGVGGGFLILPALIFFGGLAMHEAVGTSLLVIAINSLAGFLSHLEREEFGLRMTLLVTLLAVAGTVVGTGLAHRIPAGKLRKVFAVFVLMIGLFLIVKNLPV